MYCECNSTKSMSSILDQLLERLNTAGAHGLAHGFTRGTQNVPIVFEAGLNSMIVWAADITTA